MTESRPIEELEIIQTAVLERIRDLEGRRRLPRGYTVKTLRNEIAALEREATRLGRERSARQIVPGHDLTNGAG